ncbi:MAG: C40 family peptidase [Prolixibacteraceae bacterium]|nr:C40 family peptidase [Prolixibacteraceae bacterium]
MNHSYRHIGLNLLLLLLCYSTTWAQVPNFKALNAEIQKVQKQLVPDKRVAILDISFQDTLQPIFILKGKTDLPEAKTKIVDLLKDRGIQFVDSFEVLPEVALDGKIWGLATLSVCSMRSYPDHAAEMVSQTLMGTPLRVLEFENGWFRVQTPDHYIGWMEGNGLTRLSHIILDVWKKSNRYVYNSISGVATDVPDRKGMVVTDLVIGDLFEVESEVKDYLKIRIPDGRTGFVKKDECLSWKEWTTRTPDVLAMISFAQHMLGLPYLWGGTSSKSLDCSGMTKTCYYTQAIILERDASQQARHGKLPDFKNIETLQPGDLLFFGRNAQRVTHVGLYMGNGKYIHASGLVRINSIDPKAPDYNLSQTKELVTSSRILNSLNTEGITLVKDHPWYVVVNQK